MLIPGLFSPISIYNLHTMRVHGGRIWVVLTKLPTKMKPAILTRCSPRKLLKVNASLNNDQEFAIKNIHYGGLLHLSSYLLPGAFMVQILERFNPESCALWLHSGGIQTITPSDVSMILCFRHTEILMPTDPSPAVLATLKRQFYMGRGGISLTTLGVIQIGQHE